MSDIKLKPIIENKHVIGHSSVVSLLSKALDSGRLTHAYLFTGPSHVGKTTVAEVLARALLETDKELAIHPDFFRVARREDPKTGKLQNGILLDQIHELRTRLSMSALMRGWKVAIMEDAHLMNKESSNALLKSLEEPHARTLLILVADSADSVLPTIRSRCQEIVFPRVPIQDIVKVLMMKGVDAESAELYARLSGGRPGIALTYHESPDRLDAMRETRKAIFGFPACSVAERWRVVEEAVPTKLSFNEAGLRAQEFLDLATELLRDLLLIHHGNAQEIVHVDAMDAYARWEAQLTPDKTEAALIAAGTARARIAQNVSPRTALEHFVLSF